MSYNSKNWNHTWFGFWNEYGEGYENCPSVFDFIDKTINETYDKTLLCNYLNNGIVLVSTSLHCFPSPVDGKITYGSVSYRTDGKWVWFDNIVSFIENDNLTIPEVWYQEIEAKKFIFPDVSSDQLDNIGFPDFENV